jgi:hypothetical protein
MACAIDAVRAMDFGQKANRVGLSDRLIPIFAAPVFYLRLIDAPGTLIQRVLREGSKGEGYESLVTRGALQ